MLEINKLEANALRRFKYRMRLKEELSSRFGSEYFGERLLKGIGRKSQNEIRVEEVYLFRMRAGRDWKGFLLEWKKFSEVKIGAIENVKWELDAPTDSTSLPSGDPG